MSSKRVMGEKYLTNIGSILVALQYSHTDISMKPCSALKPETDGRQCMIIKIQDQPVG